MKNEEYICYINKMLASLSNEQLKKVFDSVQRIFVRSPKDDSDLKEHGGKK